MSDLKRQMSWHEDFAKNFSRFFSRSKSVDTEGNESEISEADGSTDQTPELHPNTSASAQESQPSDVLDGSSASQREDGGSTPQTSTAPPADGFLRRLGSLFQFSRAEPARGQRETQTDTDSSCPITAQRETQSSANTQKSGGGEEPVEPSVCHSELTHTQSQEQTEEDRSDAVNINAKERSDEKRRFDLACPPVVTYGTYRGLREVRKPKKKHHVELHSPISEGEEATQPDGHEDNEISSSSVNIMNSDCQEYPTAVNQASPSQTQQLEDALTQSDLLDEVPTVESGQTPAHQLPHVADSDRLLTCIEVYRIPQAAEPSPLNDPVNSRQGHLAQSVTLETVSGDTNDPTRSNAQDRHDTLPIPEQSSEQPKLSVIVNRTDDLSPACPEESKLKPAAVVSGIDEEVQRLESKKMVDSILTNALAALQKMEVSETEHDTLLTCELNEGSEAVRFEGLDGRRDGGTDAEHQFRLMLSDQTLSVVLEEDLAGSCSHMDCSRSPPSSGYESIAGSDTDIRCFVGLNSDLTTTSAPIGSQNENQTVLEYFVEDVTGSRKSSGRNSAADDEPLSQNLHSHRDVVHKTDIKLFLPALSEESLSQEQHTGDVSACKDKGGKRSQGTAKDNAMSNNCRPHLNGSCDSSIITPASAVHQESLQHSQTLSVTLSDSFSQSLASDTADSDMMSEIPPQPPAIRSHESEETEAPYSGSSEQEQISRDSSPGTDLSVQPSVTEVQCSGEQHHPSHWASVQAFLCDVTDDQSLSPATPEEHLKPELSVNLADAVSVSGRRTHLNPMDISSRTAAFVPHHSRFHDLDLHQVDGGFAIISEEEESDMVFVNDTGPLHSPSTRRAKAYPFSLSPIYEEESGREEALRQETLQFPPATEEEQRSVEQPGSSVLSLLQSVSERLQSSVICSSDEDPSRSIASPQSYRYSRGDDSEEDDEDSSNLLNRQLTGAEPEANIEHEHSSNIDRTAYDAPDRIQEEQDSDGTLGNIGKNGNTPFYQYLKSGLTPSGDEEHEDTKRIVRRSECNAVVMEENGGFGKVNPRPTPMLIYEGQSLSGERREICDDVEDTGWDLFAHRATLHALRGCWLLYVDSWYRGSCVLLEEGQTVKTSGRAHQNLEETREPSRTDPSAGLSVGSIRTLLKDDSVPEIHLYPSTSQTGETVRLYSATDLMERHGPVFLSDLRVETGCWLVFEQPGFSGTSAVLETAGRVTPVLQDSLLSCVKSLRPLNMGGLRVTRPLDPKIMLFEKPQFQGQCRELLDHTACLRDIEGPVSSLRVTGGIWVGFSIEGFRGHQCVLEEGEYGDCTRLFGGTELWIQSLRYIQTDFLEPSVCLKSSDEETHVHLDVPDLQEADCISVNCGAWVAYSGRRFSGQQYVLEKGQYPGQLQWGDGRSSAQSLRPVHREVCRIVEPEFLLRAYSQTRYGGESRAFESDVPDCGAPGPASFRVIRGSWLLFDEEGYSGNQYILGEGLYPDLTSCGCISTSIKSLKPIPYSFTEPSVSLFSLSGFQGLEETSLSDVENTSHFFSQSVRVHSGLWVAYEYAHFKGRQMLVQPGEYPAWGDWSGWETIGSLKPLKQPKVFVHVRSRALGSVLTTESKDGSFPAKLFLRPADRSLDTQRWIFTDGLLKNTVSQRHGPDRHHVALRGCLSVIGAKACAGARVALWEEHGRMNQRWSLSEDGSICSHLNRSLVLDLKGGYGADRDQLILSPLRADSAAQAWDMDVL